MRLDIFEMERLQSTWENRVRFNLSESSVHPMSVRELISDPVFLAQSEMDAIIRAASRSGAWILADEIYQGSERDGKTTPTFWGRYDRVIVTNGLSKAYGLPGLRIGWIVAREEIIAKMWSYHDYTTIAPGTLSDALARIALSPEGRARCLERTRRICRDNFPLFQEWIRSHGSTFRMVEPRAGAIAYVRYNLPINSCQLMER